MSEIMKQNNGYFNSRKLGVFIVRVLLCVVGLCIFFGTPGSVGGEPSGGAPGSAPGSMGAGTSGGDRVVYLDGTVIEGKVGSIGTGGKVEIDGQLIDLAKLRRIEHPVFPDDLAQVTGCVYLSDGSRIAAHRITVGDEKVIIKWNWSDPLEMPVDNVKGILFARGDKSELKGGRIKPVFLNALSDDQASEDKLFAIQGRKITELSGALQELNDQYALFVFKGKPRKVARGKMYGVRIATSANESAVDYRYTVGMSDGSELRGSEILTEGKSLIVVRRAKQIRLPWENVKLIQIKSDRVVWLSDLEPVAVQQGALFTYSQWRRDRSLLNKPLRLGDRVFEKGLAVHGPCQLSYEADRRYDMFAATIGIDHETYKRGDCVFKVIGDGKELFSRRMRGTDEPVDLTVKISGIERVTLKVEAGEDFDLADHADWCDARFIKNSD